MAVSYAIATVIESSIYCAQDVDVDDHSTAAKVVNITMELADGSKIMA